MTAISVDRIVPLTFTAMRVTPQYVPDLFALIQAAKEARRWKGEPTPVDLADGSVGWQILFRYEDGRPDITAHPGYWVIADSDLNIEVYDPPTGVTKFHQNVTFEWDGLTNPPHVSLNEDGTVKLSFRQPKSINGPWSYTVTRVDLADDSTADFTPLGDVDVAPVADGTFRVIGADVSFDIAAGLTTGHDYRFKLIATADSFGATAETPLSEPISLPA